MIAPGRYWVIRHPVNGDSKKTVLQFDTAGETVIPDEVAEYEQFAIQKVSDRSPLGESVDQSGLTDDEKELLKQVSPIQT